MTSKPCVECRYHTQRRDAYGTLIHQCRHPVTWNATHGCYWLRQEGSPCEGGRLFEFKEQRNAQDES